MDRILSSSSVNNTDLKKNPSRIVFEAEGAPVAILILSHNKPSA